jgi:MFS family permease
MRARYFHGWNVVAGTFVTALLSFGLGFYGLTVYAATLQRAHGWSAVAVSAPITAYYIAGALVTAMIGGMYERFGPRVVVAGASVAMAIGVAALGIVARPWQLYPVFLVMAIGWGALSGAAINIILAPWFERRRGLAVSLAFNGATLGGVLVTPALLALIAAIGWPGATRVAALVLLIVLFAVAGGVMRRHPGELGLGPDGDPPPAPTRAPCTTGPAPRRHDAVRRWRFWSVSITFALGLAAQVGVLTHLVQIVAPIIGPAAAGRAVSTTAAAALVGRLLAGSVVDRMNPRRIASATLVVQIVGVFLLARATTASDVYVGCGLFGLGVGNLTTLPGLILAVEWPRERFAGLVGLVVGINQFTFAFGPTLVGVLRDRASTYEPALGACVLLQAVASIVVLTGPGGAGRRPRALLGPPAPDRL